MGAHIRQGQRRGVARKLEAFDLRCDGIGQAAADHYPVIAVRKADYQIVAQRGKACLAAGIAGDRDHIGGGIALVFDRVLPIASCISIGVSAAAAGQVIVAQPAGQHIAARAAIDQIVLIAAFDQVGSVKAVESVLAIAAAQHVSPACARDRIVTRRADKRRLHQGIPGPDGATQEGEGFDLIGSVGRAAQHDPVFAAIEQNCIVGSAAAHDPHVGGGDPCTEFDRIGAGSIAYGVLPIAQSKTEGIVASTTDQRIAAGAAGQQVVVIAAIKAVVPAATQQSIVAGIAIENVIAALAVDGIYKA